MAYCNPAEQEVIAWGMVIWISALGVTGFLIAEFRDWRKKRKRG